MRKKIRKNIFLTYFSLKRKVPKVQDKTKLPSHSPSHARCFVMQPLNETKGFIKNTLSTECCQYEQLLPPVARSL